MSNIKRLSHDVATKIAAGEVVERPFNVVKELMENSIDAQSTKITVEISGGGLSLIRVTDDGNGIDKDDLSLALERFATSKATSIDDVYSANTFGFRGEALAAISVVSNFTLRSGRYGEKTFEIKSIFGKVEEIRPTINISGTMAEVVNLFENVPARRKFLKSSKSLESEVVKLVKHFSLINPDVDIKLICNAQEQFFVSKLDDITKRAMKVFNGKVLLKGIYYNEGVQVTVATTSPDVSDRLKRDNIIVGVNGRLIKDNGVVQSVIQSYFRLIPSGSYPCCAVDIRIDPTTVDSNVHPAKLEVRFENSNVIFKSVMNAIKNAIYGEVEVAYEEPAYTEPVSYVNEEVKEYKPRTNLDGIKESLSKITYDDIATSEEITFNAPSLVKNEKIVYNEINIDIESKNAIECKIVGQIQKSFIICELNGIIMFIDQHAAHERIIFDKIEEENSKNIASIVLATKLEVELNDELTEIAKKLKEIIESYGYSFNFLNDNLVEIKRVPLLTVRRNIEQQFKNTLAEIGVSGVSKTEDYSRVMNSCKKAIKAGDELSVMEMEYLVANLFKTKNSKTCPHGRPITFTMKIVDLARNFLR